MSVGNNYSSILVAAEAADVAEALASFAPTAFAKSAAAGRTAVGDEFFFGSEEVNEAAARLSRLSEIGAVAFWVYSSVALSAIAYRDGLPVHCYDSTADTLIARVIERDGRLQGDFENPYYLYEAGDPNWPSGVRGADPDWLLPFAAGAVDRDVLARLLDLRLIPDDKVVVRGDGSQRWLFASEHHCAIAEALHLDPAYLCGELD